MNGTRHTVSSIKIPHKISLAVNSAGTKSVSIEPGQPPHLCSLTRLYTVSSPISSSHLDIPKKDNGQFQKWKVDYSIKEFQQVKDLKILFALTLYPPYWTNLAAEIYLKVAPSLL